jgi:iron(III) transport system ATP-binding protein
MTGGNGSSGSSAALEVSGVRKAFGATVVLDGVDLVVPTGTIAAVLGPSGGGKTTLLRIIAGFDDPDAGEVVLDGRKVAGADVRVPAERRRVGVVPQEGALFPHLDVAHNVAFGLPRGRESYERVAELLELVGLPGLQRSRPHQLSGGQQHRVALARALAPRPHLVVLDEPFSSLDAGLRAQIREEVTSALQSARTTAIVVTHDQQEALSMADQVAVLLGGRIAQCAAPASLYDAPASLAVATFVGDAVVLPGDVNGAGRVQCVLGTLDIRADAGAAGAAGRVDVVLRPEQLEIVPVRATAAAPVGPGAAGVHGTVVSRSYFGHDGLVRVRLSDSTEVTARLHSARLPAPGAPVMLTVNSPVSVFAPS